MQAPVLFFLSPDNMPQPNQNPPNAPMHITLHQTTMAVAAGNLVVYQRPSTYQERRSDGYEEPQLIFILGTAHVSQQSADDVTRLIAAVQPDAVVVELCKSRTGVLHVQDNIQQQEVSLQQQQQQEWQQRWQQQWQDWQQRRSQQQGGGIPAASSSASSSLEEDAPSTSSPSNTSSTMLTSTTSSSQNTSSDNGMWSQWQSFLRRSQSAKASNPLSLSGPDPLSAMARSASLGGQQAMLLRLLIAGQARKAAGEGGLPTAVSKIGALYSRTGLQDGNLQEAGAEQWLALRLCRACFYCCLDWNLVQLHWAGRRGVVCIVGAIDELGLKPP